MSVLIITAKKDLKRQTNYEILDVKQIDSYKFDVINIRNKHSYHVDFDRKLGTLGCDCMFGSQEIGTGIVDELHRCKHVQSVRQYLEKEK